MEIDNYNDAVRIYKYSLIRIDRELVLVKNVLENLTLIGMKLRSADEVRESVNSEKIDRYPIKTGFVNGFGTTVYVTRKTSRTYSQGLTSENISVREIIHSHGSGELIDEVVQLRFVGLCDMADGIYPSLHEAHSMIANSGGRINSIAFERNKALDYKGIVWYRSQPVGRYDADNDVVKLKPEFKHLNWIFQQKCE